MCRIVVCYVCGIWSIAGFVCIITESNHNLCNMVTQCKFLTALQTRLKDSSGSKIVLQEIGQLRQEVTKPENFRIFVSTDITKVTGSTLEPWTYFPSLPVNITPR